MDVRNDGELPAELIETVELLTRLIAAIQHDGDGTAPGTLEIMASLRQRQNLAELPCTILKAYHEIASALSGIRLTRETIESHALERLSDSTSRLTEVTSTTESAALEMMNGLDRTLTLIDQLEQDQIGTSGNDDAAHFDALRHTVNDLFGLLQFQDIITQQLQGVMELLTDVERRIGKVTAMFDQSLTNLAPSPADELPMACPNRTYNEHASSRDVATRQAMIDQAFEENQPSDAGMIR